MKTLKDIEIVEEFKNHSLIICIEVEMAVTVNGDVSKIHIGGL